MSCNQTSAVTHKLYHVTEILEFLPIFPFKSLMLVVCVVMLIQGEDIYGMPIY